MSGCSGRMLATLILINILTDITKHGTLCQHSFRLCRARGSCLCPSPTAPTFQAGTFVHLPPAAYMQTNLSISDDFKAFLLQFTVSGILPPPVLCPFRKLLLSFQDSVPVLCPLNPRSTLTICVMWVKLLTSLCCDFLICKWDIIITSTSQDWFEG